MGHSNIGGGLMWPEGHSVQTLLVWVVTWPFFCQGRLNFGGE